ncbi:MAG: chromosome segregation protein SMC [Verrucomicrobia bacterium]|nr:chromosome segregation protein SMC [Verrucomicrobiota bacterium]
MYLKSLTEFGFKSFADKTTLTFLPGITAIVGPNGCGKSNIADAIRWVLGEQSAKALRGGEMADVIFNGSDGRKPLSMAEVSLTIGDVERDHLRAAGVELDYNEVTLTRRVFRDGVSEYFINRTPCRLKDIQQLFMGTGVGRASYSIMAQGHITQLLSSRPEDRRAVFEEAAGITRFKSQKRETLRKLESTEQNLVRVADLVREVKRQIGSLQRQAGKARRYKQFMLQLQHLDTQLARHEFDRLQAQRAELETTAEQLRADIETGSAELLRTEDETARLRERLSDLEQQVHEAQQRGQDLQNQVERHQSRIHFNEERLRESEQQNAKALGDIAQGEERRLAAEQERAAVAERLAGSVRALAGLQESLQTKREALRQVETELKGNEEELRRAQAAAFEQAQRLSGVRNQLTALDLQRQHQNVRMEKLTAERIQLEEERRRLEARLGESAASVENEKRDARTRRGAVAEHQARLHQLEQALAAAGQELDRRLQEQTERRSRRGVLAQLQADYEGFSAGTVAALKQAPQMLGALVDRMRVSEPHIAAVEAALGHHLQLVLTEEAETAQQVVAELKIRKQGRASVAPLALQRNGKPVNAAPGPAGEGAPVDAPASGSVSAASVTGMPCATAVPALSVIEADVSIQPLLNRLLGQTWIVPDLTTATRAWHGADRACDFVTTGGEVLNRHGVYVGGASNGAETAPASVLGRKNQIAELDRALAELQAQIQERSRARGVLQAELTALQASLQQTQADLNSQEVAIATHEGECRALENARGLLQQKLDTVAYEIQSLETQDQENLRQGQALARQAAELEAGEQELQRRLADLNVGLERLRHQRDTANNGVTEAKVALATEEQVGAALRQQEQSFAARLQELAQLVEQRRGEIAALLQRRTQFEAEIAESRRQIVSLQGEREQVNARIAERLQERSGLEVELAERETGIRERRRQLAEQQERRGTLEVELAQKEMAGRNLCERVQEKYKLNLADVRSECITITIADEGPPKVETLSPDEMAARGVATDWALVAQQVTALQTRIDEMGPVNLVAIEEYEETEQRYQFLTAQHDDLVTAKQQLLDVINRINVETRAMFRDTFEKIRANFSALFTEIFGGGKADLALVDEGDVLESGVEIIARPPGKQAKSISLLSGGEQTMVAVALLFAIYQVRPSPFCVLDELDAALDEANINRFVRVLQRFLGHSQFIVITHNKRTIGMADVIYGVTMQEQGVSKIVSVKFHKAEAGVEPKPAPVLEPKAAEPSIESEEDRPHEREQVLEMVMAK